ncbi:hypothetical protein Enr8_18090 [Blastopirellula retiformator]|uniref:VWFA domain-containing protein n=2 Tax=Blastopirellula retiformator TaxID=2527970 RepID=A0A5C5V7Z2_9BACT|nr:hypothetical protein Enr8_18090 [Blastopirellula retiformator]
MAILLLALLAVPAAREVGNVALLMEERQILPLESFDPPEQSWVLELPAAQAEVEALVPSDSPPSSLTSPQLENLLVETTAASSVSASPVTATAASGTSQQLGRGSGHISVGNYDDAMDQITLELIRLLQGGEVVVVWLFDQSSSMQDDRAMIGARIGRVYQELAKSGFAERDALTTGIASYSGDYAQHTANPTSKLSKIYGAIEAVPVDSIGKELTCQAVNEAITRHRRYVEKTERQFALIVVTDESGDPEDNRRYLEEAIDSAKALDCHVYFLGREALFGYPFAHTVSRDPQTGGTLVSTYDRGPETAFVEQLQTDGFAARSETLLSGFGPYEQVRLTRETGGLFFMMPDDKRYGGYDPAEMERYQPDWRSRAEIAEKVEGDPLQLCLSQVIQELNPYQSAAVNSTVIRQTFSSDPATLPSEILQEQAKMRAYINYFNQAIQTLEAARPLRNASHSVRQQANYDLILAQLRTYRIRAAEFHDLLAIALQMGPAAAPAAPIRGWKIVMQPQLVSAEKHATEIALARSSLEHIAAERPGTPWARSAQAELDRGFGVGLQPVLGP